MHILCVFALAGGACTSLMAAGGRNPGGQDLSDDYILLVGIVPIPHASSPAGSPAGDALPRILPPMTQFRYRTLTLVGPWRDTLEEAERDAVAARQASFSDKGSDRLRWLVPGQIEEDLATP